MSSASLYETVDAREWIAGRTFGRLDFTVHARYVRGRRGGSRRLILNRRESYQVSGVEHARRILGALVRWLDELAEDDPLVRDGERFTSEYRAVLARAVNDGGSVRP